MPKKKPKTAAFTLHKLLMLELDGRIRGPTPEGTRDKHKELVLKFLESKGAPPEALSLHPLAETWGKELAKELGLPSNHVPPYL